MRRWRLQARARPIWHRNKSKMAQRVCIERRISKINIVVTFGNSIYALAVFGRTARQGTFLRAKLYLNFYRPQSLGANNVFTVDDNDENNILQRRIYKI